MSDKLVARMKKDNIKELTAKINNLQKVIKSLETRMTIVASDIVTKKRDIEIYTRRIKSSEISTTQVDGYISDIQIAVRSIVYNEKENTEIKSMLFMHNMYLRSYKEDLQRTIGTTIQTPPKD